MAVALAILVALAGAPFVGLAAVLGGGGILTLTIAMAARASAAVTLALLLLGVEYAVSLGFGRARIDLAAPVVGAALLVVGELAHWSLDERVAALSGSGLGARRLALLAGSAAVGILAASAVLAVAGLAGLAARRSLPLTIGGCAAAGAALALLAALARRAVPLDDAQADA